MFDDLELEGSFSLDPIKTVKLFIFFFYAFFENLWDLKEAALWSIMISLVFSFIAYMVVLIVVWVI